MSPRDEIEALEGSGGDELGNFAGVFAREERLGMVQWIVGWIVFVEAECSNGTDTER